MFSYCLKWGKNIKNVDLKVSKTKNGRTLLLSTCTVCGSKNKIHERTTSKMNIK